MKIQLDSSLHTKQQWYWASKMLQGARLASKGYIIKRQDRLVLA